MPKKKRNTWGGKRPGTGRPPGQEKVSMKIYVLPTTKKTIDRLAFDRRQTLGEVVDDKFVPKKKPLIEDKK